MKKKSIVLLITILFISSISVLILQNLKHSEEYLNEANKEFSTTQVILLVKNAQNEFLNFFSREDNLDVFIDSNIHNQTFPISLKGIDFRFNISLYSKEFNINNFSLKDEIEREKFINKVQEYFNTNQMDFYTFNEILNEYFVKYKINADNQIISSKQVTTILNDFIEKTYYENENENDLNKIFGFLPKSCKNSENNEKKDCNFLKVKLSFEHNKHEYFSSFILDTKKKINTKGVLDFEFTFK